MIIDRIINGKKISFDFMPVEKEEILLSGIETNEEIMVILNDADSIRAYLSVANIIGRYDEIENFHDNYKENQYLGEFVAKECSKYIQIEDYSNIIEF
jgi:hypothetical protein